MKILIAGASGAIGNPLVQRLSRTNHQTFGITQSKEKAERLVQNGATPLVLNVLDEAAVREAFHEIQPDVVIDMLTHLPKQYTPDAMKEAAMLDAKIRLEGGGNLLEAALRNETEKVILQSSAFWYCPGEGLADENTAFAFDASPGIAASARLYEQIETRAFKSSLVATSLRFGFFYGPGTWFHSAGNMADQVRAQKFPLIGESQGVWNFVHIEDAAQAIVAALDSPAGTYNIVNDHPSPLKEWLPAFAKSIQAPPPPHLTLEEGLRQRGADSVYYATQLRAASNAKAKKILSFTPRPFEWI